MKGDQSFMIIMLWLMVLVLSIHVHDLGERLDRTEAELENLTYYAD